MATSGKLAKTLLALTALTAFMALALQLFLSVQIAVHDGRSFGYGVISYLGFFTITTNLLVLCASVSPWLMPASGIARFFVRPAAVGWVATSIVFVGIAYFALLRHVWQPQGVSLLANVLLHYAVPSLYLLFSLIALRGVRLRWLAPCWWCLYPLAYFIYAMLRGALLHSYPYGFIDAAALGYAVTLRNGVLLLIAYLLLAYVLIALWRMKTR